MAHVYQNSLVTVISPAADPEQPLFTKRDELLTRPATLQLTSPNGAVAAVRFHPVLPRWNCHSMPDMQRQEEPGLQAQQPTRKRAWCLQEYELSRRTITFTTHQFVWICRRMQCSEEEFSGMARPLGMPENNHDETRCQTLMGRVRKLLPWRFRLFGQAARRPPAENRNARFSRRLAEPLGLEEKWEKLVEDYTSRHLTQPADRLAAIAGLAENRCRETKDRYLLGLWESNLTNELLWCVRDPMSSSSILELSKAPTWSWVAVNSPVYFPRRPYALDNFETRMVPPTGTEISITEVANCGVGPSCFTEVSSIRLTIEGRLIHASIRNVGGGGPKARQVWGQALLDRAGSDLGSVFFDSHVFCCLENWSLMCLWVDPGIVQDADLDVEPERYTGGFGLALSPKPDTMGEPTFVRVGFVRFHPRCIKRIHEFRKYRFTIL